MKRMMALICLAVMLIGMTVSVSAGDPGLMFNYSESDTDVIQGGTATMHFTVWAEDKPLFAPSTPMKVHAKIYKGETVSSNNLVASIEKSLRVDILGNTILEWDTTGQKSGVYTVEYYVSFYINYSWHEGPYRKSDINITVFKKGEVINSVLNTDIKAYIDGYPIRSFNINGKTAIVAEDLKKYGFSVKFDPEKRTLKIYDSKGKITSTYKHEKNTKPVGSKAMDVIATDINTYTTYKQSSGNKYDLKVTGYNIDGYTVIFIDHLSVYGKVKWDEEARTISFKRSK